MKIFSILSLGFVFVVAARADVPPIATDVQQSGMSGNGTATELGNPFGQSFTAGSTTPIYGLALASVNTDNARDLNFFLWHTDASGAITGNALASGGLSAAQVQAFTPQGPIITPIWIFANFNQPYSQTAGERLAFTVQGADNMHFYFADDFPINPAYRGGSLLGDRTKDLTFVTVVPEPTPIALGAFAIVAFAVTHCRRNRTI